MAHGIGHNNGPTMERGTTWRRVSWQKARADLLPNLPIEVLRRRVVRAKELGLPYKTYASVRAATGRDVIGFLFSSNALRMLRDEALPADRAARLSALVNVDRVALFHAPLDPSRAKAPLDAAFAAPAALGAWRDIREGLTGILRDRGLPADGTVIIGDTALERDWCAAARAAGYVEAERYFVA